MQAGKALRLLQDMQHRYALAKQALKLVYFVTYFPEFKNGITTDCYQ